MRTILDGEYYNALYEDGRLKHQAKPDYLDAHTLVTVFPEAEYYTVPECVYEAMGDSYPEDLADFPLEACTRYR